MHFQCYSGSSILKCVPLIINFVTIQDLFLGVVDHQCLEYVHRPKDIDNAPTVRSCIEHFNRVSLVVIATILGGVAAEGRGSVISHWIDIAQNCRAVKNFSSLKAIVSGLQSTTVHRLKKSWNMVSR